MIMKKDRCRICNKEIEKKPNRLWCSECRKSVDKAIKEYLAEFYGK